MATFRYLTMAAKYVLPYIKPSCSNIVNPLIIGVSAILPAIDFIFLHLYQQNTKTEEENNNSFNNPFVISGILVGAGLYCRPIIIKYLAESIKISIKKINNSKYLDNQNKFLISNSHCESSQRIKSLQDVTLGYRVDILSETAISMFIGLPLTAISLGCGIKRIDNISGFLETKGYIIALPAIIGGAFIIYGAGRFLGHYDTAAATINSELLLRSSFIENNRDSITLMKAVNAEKDIANNLLIQRAKIVTPYAALESTHIITLVGVGELLVYYLASHAPTHMKLANIMYLSFSVYAMMQDLIYFVNTSSQGLLRFKDHADKVEDFNRAYDEWSDIYTKHNKLKSESGGRSFALKNFNIFNKADKEEKLIHEIRSDNLDQYSDHEETKGLLSSSTSKPTHIININIILHDVNLELMPGKIYQLMGKSGIGKTTIIKAILGCWPYTEGTVIFPVPEDNIYCIPQTLCFFPNYTLLQNIAYPLTVEQLANKIQANYDHIVSKIKSLMEECHIIKNGNITADELQSATHAWTGRLSGGETQKVAIIAAIMHLSNIHQPGFLIMDEITSNMDATDQTQMYGIIRRELPNSTILFTNHNTLDIFGTEKINKIYVTPDHKLTLSLEHLTNTHTELMGIYAEDDLI